MARLFDLDTDRLKLSEVTLHDISDIHALHSIPEVDEFNTLGIPASIKDTEEFLTPIIEAQANEARGSFMWKISLKDDDQFIGVAGLSVSYDKFRIGELYYKVHPQHWGRGYATELAKRLVVLGFDHFGLHRVEAGVAVENEKSMRVLEKIGMTQEGRHRKILPIRGVWMDNYHYAIVEDDPRDY